MEGRLKPCSYFVVRYAANLTRNEGINIGVLLHCPEEHYLGCLFADDFRWVRRFDPRADLHLLGDLQQHMEEQIEFRGPENYLKELTESLSNTLQIEGPRVCLLEKPAVSLQDVYARNVGKGIAAPPAAETRLRIKHRLAAAFADAGILDLLEKRIAAARWTQPGDPFSFDFGYQLRGAVRLIHALSLRRDTQLAKTLVYTLDRVRRSEEASLTAVVEDAAEDRAAAATRGILEDGRIAVQALSGVEQFAQTIRADLMAA